MVAYSVFRVAKLPSVGAIAGAHKHNARTGVTPNADPARQVRVMVDGGPDLAATVAAKIAAAGAKVRADSVLAVEAVLSASPEYFRPDQPEAAGVWDHGRMEAWAKAHWGWAKKEFGDRIVDARLHLDESTPHIQFVFVPLAGDRLSAFEVVGRRNLRRMQTESAAAVAHLGIHRGIEGSQAHHTSVRKYYAEINAPAPSEPAPVRRVKVPVPPVMVKESTREEWASAQNKVGAEILREERNRYALEVAPHLARSKAVDRLKKERDEARATAAAAIKRAHTAEEAAQKAQERAEAAQVRDISLDHVVAAYGLDIGPDGRFQGEGMSIRLEGAAWWDDGDRQARGRGAIDLAKHLNQTDYKGAIAWLKKHFGQDQTKSSIVVDAQVRAELLLPTITEPVFVPPVQDESRWPGVRNWLLTVRRLAADLVDWLHGKGRIYADAKSNAVFLMTDSRGRAVGAELKGTKGIFTGMAPGTSRNAGAFTIPSRDRDGDRAVDHRRAPPLVVTESAIDAISYAQLHPGADVEIKSTGGIRREIPWIDPRRDLIVAYDADGAGDNAAAGLLAKHAGPRHRHRPQAKDWNDQVKAQVVQTSSQVTGFNVNVDLVPPTRQRDDHDNDPSLS